LKISFKKVISSILLVLFVLIVLLGGALVYLIYWPFFVPKNAPTVEVTVRWGATFSAVAEELQDRGVVRSAKELTLTANLFKKTQKLRVGRFTLKKGSSNHAALWALLEGPQTFINLTLPDGYDSRRYAGIIQKHLEIDSGRVITLVHDPSFVASLGIDTPSLEGYLYPETYRLTYGLRAEQLLQLLVQQFRAHVPDSLRWSSSADGLNFNQILTLASIIEGEAMMDDEMPTISSVYHNRLKLGMRLQADPTIQYLLPDGPRRLLKRDLTIDSPYNTYLYSGLPPTPINNPGRNAILAALYPAETDFLFFVAIGNGRHTFSQNYQQHLTAKRSFDQVRKQVEQEKKAKQP
jgi:UPF0755 protein